MYRFKIDDTGVEFNSMNELSVFLNCTPQNVWWWRKKHSDTENHFMYQEYGITILESRRPDWHKSEKSKAQRKRYYKTHKEYFCKYQKQWKKAHPEKIKEYSKREHIKHREWYNAYYREYYKKRKKEAK